MANCWIAKVSIPDPIAKLFEKISKRQCSR